MHVVVMSISMPVGKSWPMLGVHAAYSRHQQLSSIASIELHVELIDQLFNSIDPSLFPFHTRDMHLGADAYIVDSSKGLARDAPLALIIHLDRPPNDEAKLG